MGIDSEATIQIDSLAQQAIAAGTFPGIEILVAKGETILLHQAYGHHSFATGDRILSRDSLFDLASLTKPLATATAVLHLVSEGRLSLVDTLARHIPEVIDNQAKTATLQHLLSHSSGLPDWEPLFEPDFDRSQGWKRLVELKFKHPPETVMEYSCLGYLYLGEIIRRVSGQTLDQFCRQAVFKPLGLRKLQFNPVQNGYQGEIVPTGFCPLRNMELKGIVHDENAYLFGGEGGNSGLFGTATEIHKLCCVLLNRQTDPEFKGMFENQNPLPLLPRSLGWDFKRGKADYWSCGELMPEGSVGHLGFTGTSLWMDPASGIVIVLLSNRVIVSREENIPAIQAFRPQMHSLILDALGHVTSR